MIPLINLNSKKIFRRIFWSWVINLKIRRYNIKAAYSPTGESLASRILHYKVYKGEKKPIKQVDMNLPSDFQRNSKRETEFGIMWGY